MDETDTASSPTKLTARAALELFASEATSPEQRREALTALIALKVLPKQADDSNVLSGRKLLLRDAFSHSDPAYKLLAIAETIRLAQVVKRWLPDLTRGLEKVFVEPIPSLTLLSDADDRLNVARACALFRHEWLPDYLAQGIAEEEQGEKARAVLVESLLGSSQSIAAALRKLAQSFGQIQPKTEFPGDTISRRLTRTLSTLRGVILDSDLEAGDELGTNLQAFVQDPLVAVGRPQDEKVKIDLCREVILAVHDLVRTRISVVAEPKMYEVVGYCRRLCGGGSWPDELRKPLDRLVIDVSEALVLLGRQGQCDQSLLAQLDMLCNYPERARAVAKELAAKHPELNEDVRFWLEKGKLRNTRAASEAAIEAAASNADASIGLALQAVRQARSNSIGLRERLVSSLEIYEPSLVTVTVENFEKINALAVHVEQAANLRSISLFGTPGEEIDFSTKYFEAVGQSPRQRMLVKQPAIVKIRSDGTPGDVVLKGLVE